MGKIENDQSALAEPEKQEDLLPSDAEDTDASLSELSDANSSDETSADSSTDYDSDWDFTACRGCIIESSQYDSLRTQPQIWVFGYGSLVWKTGFSYSERIVGHIEGYNRVFWQGNCVQRGTEDQPGRVCTLEESDEGRTWGVSFLLNGETEVREGLSHLMDREVIKGDYSVAWHTFHPRDGSPPRRVLLFWASPESPSYLGVASAEEMAVQIVDARGVCGPNIDYVLRLAHAIREHIPEDKDPHLFDLERAIVDIIGEEMALESVRKGRRRPVKRVRSSRHPSVAGRLEDLSGAESELTSNYVAGRLEVLSGGESELMAN